MAEHHNHVQGPVFEPVVQARDIHGDVHVDTPSRPRSRYLEQVRQIAPEELVGREAELAALAAFCAGDEGDHLWWRAPKWAGKSALLSWFALHPPEGLRVVPFFVTARLAGQDDRGAFVDVVLEQLADLLGQPMPAFLTEATREAHFAGMLADAARRCRDRGERLVLVVDGLDEDRGAAVGGTSIAALLPARPAAGMKVVVASRPNPPPPADLDARHPLRSPSAVRELTPSPRASVQRDDMELELHRLLRGSPVEQDLLGLLTAAAGGLTDTDLADLTGCPTAGIRVHLRTAATRSFDVRPGHYRPDTRIYLLGHEELRATAEEHLGPARLAGYRDRLHAWADAHRARGWPEDTPEYLLRGYFRVLTATGEVARVVACGTDPARHDRMRALSGGDADALAEVTAAFDAVASARRPDLAALARLAVHRDRLIARNSALPVLLPALWAHLGEHARAEALADPRRTPAAAAHLAGALAEAGEFHRALDLATAITDLGHRDRAFGAIARAPGVPAEVSRALAERRSPLDARAPDAGSTPDLAALAAELRRPGGRTTFDRLRALVADTSVGRAAAGRGTWEPPAEFAGLLPADPVDAVVLLGLAAVRAGEPTAAREAALRAEELMRSAPDSGRHDKVRRALMDAHARAGNAVARDLADGSTDHRAVLRAMSWLGDLDAAEAAARAIADPGQAADATAELVGHAAARRDPDRVERLVRSQAPGDRITTLLDVVSSLADHPAAVDRLIGSLPHPGVRVRLLSALARVSAAPEEAVDRADAVIRRMANPYARVRALVRVAGVSGRRRDFLRRAVAETDAITTPAHRARAKVAVAAAIAATGDHDQALAVAATIGDDAHRDVAHTAVVKALAAAEEFDRAEQLAARLTTPRRVVEARVFLVKAVATAGDLARAVRMTGDLPARRRDEVLFGLARVGSCPELVACLSTAARSTDRARQAAAVDALVTLALADDDTDRAEHLVGTIADPAGRARAWTRLLAVEELRATGRPAARLLHLLDWTDALDALVTAHPEVLAAVDDEVRGRWPVEERWG
ncbi:hypothetical protein [Saccharothrix australiensis]|nr:hypothetical protein [Saccharothrix australiensis]